MQQQQQNRGKLASVLVFLSVAGPIICLVDCIVIPVALLILPFLGVHHIYHGVGDQILFFLVLALCAPSLIPGYFQHHKKQVLAFMSIGFGLMFFANFVPALDETVHAALSIAGSLFLIKANLDNRKFKKHQCCHKH